MKWMRFFVLSALICLMLAACGSDKPSQKQIESDLQMSNITQFPIEKVEITESHGDKSDFYAKVKLSGSEGMFSYSANGYAKYHKADGNWVLTDCDLSSDVNAVISRRQRSRKSWMALTGWSHWNSIFRTIITTRQKTLLTPRKVTDSVLNHSLGILHFPRSQWKMVVLGLAFHLMYLATKRITVFPWLRHSLCNMNMMQMTTDGE